MSQKSPGAFAGRHWPVIGAVAVFWLAMAVLLALSMRMTGGRLIYPLDDAYIHMAMAKNSILHGVWGITRYGFSSSSSSPLWTLLLLGTYALFGVNEVSPFVLNLLFGTVAVVVAYSVITKHVTGRLVVFAVCLLILFLTPLPSLAFTGMEHVLQAILTLCFVWLSARALSSTARLPPGKVALLALLAALVTAVRYEGVFLAAVVCVLFALNRRRLTAGVVAAAALLPVVAYGIWSVSAGWYFLPNSVLLKGSVPSLHARGIAEILFGYRAWATAGKSPHLLLLLIVASFLLVFRLVKRAPRTTSTYALAAFVGVTLLHLSFAQAGWFYRYDAYLVFIGVTTVAAAVGDLGPGAFAWRIRRERLPRYAAAALLVALIAGPLGIRAARSLYFIPQAAKNTYEQQYQMGLFLRRYYQGIPVAVNDIGAASFLADTKLLDLAGLGSMEPARLKLANRYGDDQAYSLANREGTKVAIVYYDWFSSRRWTEVGRWRISGNVACGGDLVSICAVDTSATEGLVRNLQEFARDLPAGVEQLGVYTAGVRNRDK